MTSDQKRWLDANPAYTIVGHGGMVDLNSAPAPQSEHHVDMGALKPDGTFVARVRPKPGDILVGKRAPDHRKNGAQQGF